VLHPIGNCVRSIVSSFPVLGLAMIARRLPGLSSSAHVSTVWGVVGRGPRDFDWERWAVLEASRIAGPGEAPNVDAVEAGSEAVPAVAARQRPRPAARETESAERRDARSVGEPKNMEDLDE